MVGLRCIFALAWASEPATKARWLAAAWPRAEIARGEIVEVQIGNTRGNKVLVDSNINQGLIPAVHVWKCEVYSAYFCTCLAWGLSRYNFTASRGGASSTKLLDW